jgi:hypothetical protein
MTFDEGMSHFDPNDDRASSARVPSTPSTLACRPEHPRTFDIKSEEDLTLMIDAIRDAHRRLNVQAAGPLKKRTTKEVHPQVVAPAPVVRPRLDFRGLWRGLWRVRVWIGALMMIGAFAAGAYSADNVPAVADPLGYTARLLARSASALVALQDSKTQDSKAQNSRAQDPQLALLRTTSLSPTSTSRDISLVLPDSYGLYAVSGGQLTRLEPLRLRVPDTRIALPGLITKPSAVSVSDGRLTFIGYQRDLMTNVPDKASIRVVAQVARVLTFPTSGKPKVTPVEDTWAMRAVSVDLTVSPVPDNQEMVMIRPTDSDLSLSPGRYVLVFKNQAYDFAVEGAITDTAHCLERTETQTGGVYTECRELP